MGSFPETYNDPSFGYSLITEKNNRFPFVDILGYLKNTHKNPKFGRDKSQSGNLVGNSLVGTCLTLPNLRFLWVFLKYPKVFNIGNLLFFSVDRCCPLQKVSVNVVHDG